MRGLIVVMWIFCGILGAGFQNAYFQLKFELCEGRRELGNALAMNVVIGPIGLFTSYLISGFGEYGWSLSTHANPNCHEEK